MRTNTYTRSQPAGSAASLNPPSKLVFSVKELQAAAGLSRTTIYELINNGELRSFKVGTRRLIPTEAWQEFVARQLTGSNSLINEKDSYEA